MCQPLLSACTAGTWMSSRAPLHSHICALGWKSPPLQTATQCPLPRQAWRCSCALPGLGLRNSAWPVQCVCGSADGTCVSAMSRHVEYHAQEKVAVTISLLRHCTSTDLSLSPFPQPWLHFGRIACCDKSGTLPSPDPGMAYPTAYSLTPSGKSGSHEMRAQADDALVEYPSVTSRISWKHLREKAKPPACTTQRGTGGSWQELYKS